MRAYNTFCYYTKKFGSYHISTYAASASFFIITAVFPLLMLVLSIISYTPLSAEDFMDMVAMILPESFGPLLQQLAEDMVTTNVTALSVSLLATLWTAAKSMLGLLDGLNAIQDVNDTRNFIFKRIICIGYMLLLILGLVLNLGLRVFGEHILSRLMHYTPGLGRVFSTVMDTKGLTLFLVFTVVFMLIYTFFPNKKMKIFLQVPGAMFTSLAWLVFSSLFSIYVNQIGQFSTLYGSLTMLILAMLWLYFCMYIVFIGAVINKNYPEYFWKCYVAVRRKHDAFKAWCAQRKDSKKRT